MKTLCRKSAHHRHALPSLLGELATQAWRSVLCACVLCPVRVQLPRESDFAVKSRCRKIELSWQVPQEGVLLTGWLGAEGLLRVRVRPPFAVACLFCQSGHLVGLWLGLLARMPVPLV